MDLRDSSRQREVDKLDIWFRGRMDRTWWWSRSCRSRINQAGCATIRLFVFSSNSTLLYPALQHWSGESAHSISDLPAGSGRTEYEAGGGKRVLLLPFCFLWACLCSQEPRPRRLHHPYSSTVSSMEQLNTVGCFSKLWGACFITGSPQPLPPLIDTSTRELCLLWGQSVSSTKTLLSSLLLPTLSSHLGTRQECPLLLLLLKISPSQRN